MFIDLKPTNYRSMKTNPKVLDQFVWKWHVNKAGYTAIQSRTFGQEQLCENRA